MIESENNLLEIARQPTKKIVELEYDPVISHLVSQRNIYPGTTRIPNSVLYEFYRMWSLTVGRFKWGKQYKLEGKVYRQYSRMKFFTNFKKLFSNYRYRTKNQRGYLLSKEPFLDYFEYDAQKDTFYEQKIKTGFK